jgi:hypothetical protein
LFPPPEALDSDSVKYASRHLCASLLGAAWIFLLVPSCSFLDRVTSLDFVDLPESRLANLEALHTPGGGHRYSAKMVGDFGFTVGHQDANVLGVRLGQPPSADRAARGEESFPNPSEKCLELLTELLDFDSADRPRLAGLQVSWCARIGLDDPSQLCRERAARGLGPLGKDLGITSLLFLPPEEPRADPDEAAGLIADLIGALRVEREGLLTRSRDDAPNLEQAIEAVRETTFDIDGARRMLVAVGAMWASVGEDSPEGELLNELNRHLRSRTIRLVLGRAIADESPVVRAAANRASVEAGGMVMLARRMDVLLREHDPRALRPFFRLLLELGLPEQLEEISAQDYAELRELWLQTLVEHAVENPDSTLRVKAMQVLTKVTETGPDTLREEDWQAWWYDRFDLRREELGLPPLPAVTKESGDENP